MVNDIFLNKLFRLIPVEFGNIDLSASAVDKMNANRIDIQQSIDKTMVKVNGTDTVYMDLVFSGERINIKGSSMNAHHFLMKTLEIIIHYKKKQA